MATICPLCRSGILKKGEKMVYCNNYKPKKDGSDWYNQGNCDFHIPYANKAFKRSLSDDDIKILLGGGKIKNKIGDTMVLDLDSEYYTRIEFAKKVEDEDF